MGFNIYVTLHRLNTGWGISRLTPLYPTNGLSYASGSQYIVVGGKAARNVWHGCYGRHFEGRHLGSNFGILNGKGACDMSFNTSLISEEQWWSPFPPTLSCWEVIVSEIWKIRPYNTCSMCCPSWARHTARRFCQPAWTRNNTSGWMASQHCRIRCCRWW
jgi:hypothetical protein